MARPTDDRRPRTVGSAQIPQVPEADESIKTESLRPDLDRPRVAGWCLGDTHMHTVYSDSTLDLAEVRRHEEGLQHDFTCITDHLDRVEGASWDDYQSRILEFGDQSPGGYVMIPGIEVTCVDQGGKEAGDAVAAGLEVLPAVHNRQTDAFGVVPALLAAGSHVSVAIAHPAGKISWTAPQVPGISGVEVISCDAVADDFWRQQVVNYAPNQAIPSARGGSDTHLSFMLTGQSATWVHCPGFEAEMDAKARRLLILRALVQGATVATGMGSLAYFTLNGAYPGDTVKVAPGEEVYADVYFHPVNNGHSVMASWALYAGPEKVRGTETPILAPGTPSSMPSLRVPVFPGITAYHLSVTFKYYLDGVCRMDEQVFCGPVYTSLL